MTNSQAAPQAGWNLAHTYACLPKMFFTNLHPTPVQAPTLIVLNIPLATSLGLDVEALQTPQGVEILAGNRLPAGSVPIAQAYAGHQFGHFAMLGDGRAVLLGEQLTRTGERVDIQLKGSGRTPYSRRGDGRAALGPMLREYIISEAMHGLGIPTSRSLAVVVTGEPVYRETEQRGAILTRVAASHLRVGTFQYASQRGTLEDLRSLAEYAIDRHFPDAGAADNRYLGLLQAVVARQAALIAKWQLVGFIHGVMNTDNMAISGETIDYGPCAFMDVYDPATVFSSIDTYGRYAYANQPPIAAWNLARFAETLVPLLHADQEQAVELAQAAIGEFSSLYQRNWLTGIRAKLGIFHEDNQDESLIEDLFTMMKKYKADYTNTFRALTIEQPQATIMPGAPEFAHWFDRWQARLERQQESRVESLQFMRRNNPAVIPRNHLVEAALASAVEAGDYSKMEQLLAILSQPYAYTSDQTEYSVLPAPLAQPYRTFCGT